MLLLLHYGVVFILNVLDLLIDLVQRDLAHAWSMGDARPIAGLGRHGDAVLFAVATSSSGEGLIV